MIPSGLQERVKIVVALQAAWCHCVAMKLTTLRQQTRNKMRMNMKELARSFVLTDPYSVKGDVARLGGISQAADYCADMACGQPSWEALNSQEGREALAAAITDLL